MTAISRPIKVITAVAPVHGLIAFLTWRDLNRRPDDLIRGPKRVWRIASAMNTAGSAAYWIIGRRRTT
jgi:hypothetical protein